MVQNVGDNEITRVTSVRTISDAMNTSTIYKSMLSEVDKLLKLYYTFPVTTASSERSFSSLRRIKTFLRTTMTECRLNNVFLLYVHKSVILDLTCIATDFVSVNSRRKNILESFDNSFYLKQLKLSLPVIHVHCQYLCLLEPPYPKLSSYAFVYYKLNVDLRYQTCR